MSQRPAAAQSHRPRHAPALARPHPPRLGRRPAAVPVLQGHDESCGYVLPSRRNRVLPSAPRTLGKRHRHPTTTRPAVRHRDLRASRATVEGHPRMDSRRRWGTQATICSTSAPALASRSRSPVKTVPSSSSIRTETPDSTAPEISRCQINTWQRGADGHSREQGLNR